MLEIQEKKIRFILIIENLRRWSPVFVARKNSNQEKRNMLSTHSVLSALGTKRNLSW